jgi:parvulin-like peptidyl-prolyl isomerase
MRGRLRHSVATEPSFRILGEPIAIQACVNRETAGRGTVKRVRRLLARSFFLCAFLAIADSRVAVAAGEGGGAVVASVGDASITREEFEQALDIAARRKFYHGKTPDGEMAKLQRDVAQSMVDNVLLVKEAKRRGLKPDTVSINRTISEYEARYKTSQQWQARRAALLPKLRKQLETESMIKRLDEKVRDVAPPDAAQLQAYYAANLDKFTEPEQWRVSTILLKVDPSSPRAVWDKARAEAASLAKRIRAGADFAQQARQRSGDVSAANGGDMGYLHRGMLAEPAQVVVEKLKIKEISEPVTVLQGVAIFRLDERRPALQNPLAKVETRARELWRRDQSERVWHSLLVELRKATPAVVDESRFLPVSSSTDTGRVHAKAK